MIKIFFLSNRGKQRRYFSALEMKLYQTVWLFCCCTSDCFTLSLGQACKWTSLKIEMVDFEICYLIIPELNPAKSSLLVWKRERKEREKKRGSYMVSVYPPPSSWKYWVTAVNLHVHKFTKCDSQADVDFRVVLLLVSFVELKKGKISCLFSPPAMPSSLCIRIQILFWLPGNGRKNCSHSILNKCLALWSVSVTTRPVSYKAVFSCVCEVI